MVAEADSSDHKPVGAVFTLPSVLSPAQVVSDCIESAPPPSRLTAHTLTAAALSRLPFRPASHHRGRARMCLPW